MLLARSYDLTALHLELYGYGSPDPPRFSYRNRSQSPPNFSAIRTAIQERTTLNDVDR